MNSHVKQLFEIARKPVRNIVGLMSGTSLDGLDVALCTFSGSDEGAGISLRHFRTVAFDDVFKEKIRAVFAKEKADLKQLTLMNAVIGRHFGNLVLECLAGWGVAKEEVDLIASHGQTIFHAPRSLHGLDGYPDATLQIGDGDHIAVTSGIITVSDFRQKHVAAGGEGAPLAAYGDYLLFSDPGENRFLLNVGGIANFTFLPARQHRSAVFSSDVGPGNTLMDQYMVRHFPGKYFDQDAQLAKQGKVINELLHALLDHPFFDLPFPKTTGPELFNYDYLEHARSVSGTSALDHADTMATLCAFTAEAIALAVRRSMTGDEDFEVYVSGGGLHNPLLKEQLAGLLGGKEWRSTADLGIDPDAKEAILFALLANETVARTPSAPENVNGMPAVCMGKISFPV